MVVTGRVSRHLRDGGSKPSLEGYSPDRGDVVADDKGVPVSGRKGGPLAVDESKTL